MNTKSEMAAYRQALLESGVGVDVTDAVRELMRAQVYGARKPRPDDTLNGGPLLRLVKASRDNPSCEVHGVPVDSLILCGIFHDDDRVMLVLPPQANAFEATLDFLRFEAMRYESLGKPSFYARVSNGWFVSKAIMKIVEEVKLLGVRTGIIKPLEFESGRTNAAFGDVAKDGVTYEVVRSGFKAAVIGTWAVSKTFKNVKDAPVVSKKVVPASTPRTASEKGFRVTHTKLGRSAGSGYTQKAARALAKTLAESPYPWRLARTPDEMLADTWRAARIFAENEIRKAHQKSTRTKRNPSRQLTLFDPSPGQNDE